jgi:hypothetical protein
MTNPASPKARADDGDHRPRQHLQQTAHAEQRRRVVDQRQPRRIAGLARRHQADADVLAGGEFGACVFFAADAHLTRRAATLRQIGQAAECRPRAAEMIDQRAEGARTDVVGTDQPQPVDPLLVG